MFERSRMDELERRLDAMDRKLSNVDFGPKPAYYDTTYLWNGSAEFWRTRVTMSVHEAIKAIMSHIGLKAEYIEGTPAETKLVKKPK